MRRFFTTKLSFGEESTAIKILYLIKDRYIKDLDIEDRDKRDKIHKVNKHSPRTFYSQQGPYDSNKIKDGTLLVSCLSEAILDTIDYKKYKKLFDFEKDDIRTTIAEVLYIESNNYESSYYEPDEESPINFHQKKGISLSLQFTNYPYDEGCEVNFPEKLFLNLSLLKECVYKALDKHPTNLLKKENFSPDVQCNTYKSNNHP